MTEDHPPYAGTPYVEPRTDRRPPGQGQDMPCPYCKGTSSRVIETRIMSNRTDIRRRRVCESCDKRFSTREYIDLSMGPGRHKHKRTGPLRAEDI